MVICPHCKTKFPAGRVLIEEFQTTKSEDGKSTDTYLMFHCPDCDFFLDIKERSHDLQQPSQSRKSDIPSNRLSLYVLFAKHKFSAGR